MAKNLRAKIPATDTLLICDTNPNATKKFVEEAGTGIHITENPKEVGQKAVSMIFSLIRTPAHCFSDEFYPIYDLSWGLLWFSLF